uniref:Huntingtin interacting protein 1 related b n=1 Tax=Paramormyrops kingsleyae TaxID=1676925 RepID=A0A3B3R863_9TELE
MNSIRQVPTRVKSRRTETTLGAEREHFDKQQLSSISKAINSSETPVKEKHARRIVLGTHREKGAFTFWSYALGLPLASSSILSWKFCHVLHKVLRDGHHNSLQDCMRHHSNIKEMGTLWVSVGCGNAAEVCHWVCVNSPPPQHTEIQPNLEVSDEVLERTAGTDINNVFQLTVEVFDYLDYELKLAETVMRQLNTSIAISTTTSGQCRLAPLIQVIQDCSHLYHFTVKLLFKLHACEWSSLSPRPLPSCVPPPRSEGHTGPLRVGLGESAHLQFCEPANRDVQIDNLKREIELLRVELERIKAEAQRFITQLKSQINSLEAELEEQRAQKQRALVENEQLRMELEALRRQSTENEGLQTTFMEAEKRAQATEMRYAKLKEKHAELVSSHAELLRKSADTVKMLSATQQTQEEVARTHPAHPLFLLAGVQAPSFNEQKFEMDRLRRELEEKRNEVSRIQGAGQKLNGAVAALQAEKEALLRSVSEREAELSSLRQDAQLQQSSLQQERERSTRELGELQGKLQEKASREEQLQQKLLEEQFSLLQGTVTEAEAIIQDAAAKLDDPLHVRCTSSPDYLITRVEATLGSIDKVKQGHGDYMRNMGDASGLLRALTQFSHLTADTIVNGSATAHMAPTDHADRLTESCRNCATQSLSFLRELKSRASLQRADPVAVRLVVQRILQLSRELQPKGRDIREEELGDMVDKEMAATSAAIEEAVRRIDVSQLPVTKILNSCTDLMKAIRMLVIASTDLQKEIVESGRGAASVKEFYARNSRWTEGLISASKAVGWGATQMVESADKVVLHMGKYEELIVCSHEIAASTAQLVAASKVKADCNSRKLTTLQQASRYVNEMAAKVVASTKTGQEQIEERDNMDFSGMSLIKLRKEEMESQVKVLELETQLESERMRLGELRKKHYELAGEPLPEGNGFTSAASPSSPKPSKPAIMKKPPLAQKPNVPPKNQVRDFEQTPKRY